MSYEPKTWVNGGTVDAADLNHIEQGIRDVGGPNTPWVEGVKLFSYGHSYTMYPSPYSTPYTGEYMERVRTRLGMGEGFYRGRSGTPMQDTVAGMLGSCNPPELSSGPRQWTPGDRGIVLWENYINECSSMATGGNATYRNQWKHACRTGLALMSSSQVISVEDATRSAGWTKLGGGANYWYNDTVYFSSTAGNTVTFSVTGDSCWVLVANSDASYNVGRVEVKVGSTVLTTIAGTGEMVTFNSVLPGGAARSYSATAYKITGMNAAGGTGTKNIVLRTLDARNTFVSAVFIPSTTPPHVFLALEPERSPGAAGGHPEFVANDPYFRVMANDVAAEFPNVHIVDLDVGWDYTTMVGPLDAVQKFHPGDAGMKHIADKFVEAINATITGPVSGVIY